MTLRSTNLNLLPVLRALLAEGSVTRASEVLGLSQPATSHALVRLRHLLGDPLLVQVGRTMRLTPRAERLSPVIDEVCASIEALLSEDVFRPADLKRDFVIAAPDYMALLLGPALSLELARTAPGVRTHFVDVPKDLRAQVIAGDLDLARTAPGVRTHFVDVPQDLRGQIIAGGLDLAVIAQLEAVIRGLSIKAGYRDRMVGVAAPDHALVLSPPSDPADLAAFPQVGVRSGEADRQGMDAIGRAMSSTGSLSVSASQISLLAPLAARTGQFAVVPRAAVDLAAISGPVAVFALPGEPLFLDACMVWSPLLEADPAHRWFRDQLDGQLRIAFDRPVTCP